MDFFQLCLTFAIFTAGAAFVRYASYRINVRQWRKEQRNFRLLRADDVLRYALPKSVVLTTAAFITVTCPLLAIVLASALAGEMLQRLIEA